MQQPAEPIPAKRTAVPKKHCAEAWLGIMRTTETLLRAGLRRRIGPDGDLDEAYRQWYADHMREHDDAIRQLVRNLHRTAQDTGDGG